MSTSLTWRFIVLRAVVTRRCAVAGGFCNVWPIFAAGRRRVEAEAEADAVPLECGSHAMTCAGWIDPQRHTALANSVVTHAEKCDRRRESCRFMLRYDHLVRRLRRLRPRRPGTRRAQRKNGFLCDRAASDPPRLTEDETLLSRAQNARNRCKSGWVALMTNRSQTVTNG